MAARDEALRLGEYLGWVCVPLIHHATERKWIPPFPYGDLSDERFDVALWERLWADYEDAPGLGAIWPADVVEVEADSDEGAEWIRKRRPPRTASFSSRRGPHLLFRTNGSQPNPRPADGVEVLSRESGKRLLVLPPTPPKRWMPSLSPFDASLVTLPSAFVAPNGRAKPGRVHLTLGTELPPGEAHAGMVKIIGKLARTLDPDELMTASTALNNGRLPERELLGIVVDVASKEALKEAGPPPRVASSTGTTLADVHEVFDKGLHLPDRAAIDVPIAAVLTNLFDTDPVFLLEVAAASRGKTEVIDSLRGVPEVYALSTLTPATLISGYRDPKNPAKDNSLLTRLARERRRVLLMKDFGTVLSMHREARAEILAQLREVFDGSFVRADGTGREVSWSGHLGFVAGVTPAIDSHHAVIAVLGERFVYLRPREPDRRTAARMSLRNVGGDAKLREERREVVASLVAGIDPSELPPLSEAATELAIDLADFATRARTGVERDGYGAREILNPPSAEAPMRLVKQLASISRAALTLGYDQEEAAALLERLAKDSIPPIRRECLDFLQENGTSRTVAVAEGIGMPTKTTGRTLEDLAVLGLLDRTKRGDTENAANEWSLRETETSEGSRGHAV